MARGENTEFKERVGSLSMPLKRANVRRMIEADFPNVPLDKLDLEAYITKEETCNEIYQTIKDKLEMLQKAEDRYERFDGEMVQAEQDRADYLWEKFKDRNNITEEDIYARPKTTT